MPERAQVTARGSQGRVGERLAGERLERLPVEEPRAERLGRGTVAGVEVARIVRRVHLGERLPQVRVGDGEFVGKGGRGVEVHEGLRLGEVARSAVVVGLLDAVGAGLLDEQLAAHEAFDHLVQRARPARRSGADDHLGVRLRHIVQGDDALPYARDHRLADSGLCVCGAPRPQPEAEQEGAQRQHGGDSDRHASSRMASPVVSRRTRSGENTVCTGSAPGSSRRRTRCSVASLPISYIGWRTVERPT